MSDSHYHDGHHDHSLHEEEEGHINVAFFKILMLVLMFLCCGFGLIPKGCGACSKSNSTLSYMNCFSAGIFLTMAIFHMLPEGAEMYEGWVKKNEIERPFPVPYLAFFIGYVLVLGIDRVAAAYFHKGHSHSPARKDGTTDDIDAEATSRQTNELKEGGEIELEKRQDFEKNVVEKKATDSGSESTEATVTSETVSKTAAIVLVIAIGFHAFFEGIAFGLLTEIEQAWQLAVGIIVHKSAAAVSLGGAFANSGYTFRQIVLFITLFATTTPLGIVIGMQLAETSQLLDTILLSISGGTFIYVACSEIIVHEFDRKGNKCVKLLLVLLGGAVITSLWFLGGHHHNHGGDHDSHEGHEH